MARTLFAGCQPVFMWMIARHGTRYPSEDFFESNAEEVCKVALDNLLRNRNGKFAGICSESRAFSSLTVLASLTPSPE